jgi:hypothetical protein
LQRTSRQTISSRCSSPEPDALAATSPRMVLATHMYLPLLIDGRRFEGISAQPRKRDAPALLAFSPPSLPFLKTKSIVSRDCA